MITIRMQSTDPELKRARKRLPEIQGNYWNYLGTWTPSPDGNWQHCFRRESGGTGRRYIHIPASEGWEPELYPALQVG